MICFYTVFWNKKLTLNLFNEKWCLCVCERSCDEQEIFLLIIYYKIFYDT